MISLSCGRDSNHTGYLSDRLKHTFTTEEATQHQTLYEAGFPKRTWMSPEWQVYTFRKTHELIKLFASRPVSICITMNFFSQLTNCIHVSLQDLNIVLNFGFDVPDLWVRRNFVKIRSRFLLRCRWDGTFSNGTNIQMLWHVSSRYILNPYIFALSHVLCSRYRKAYPSPLSNSNSPM